MLPGPVNPIRQSPVTLRAALATAVAAPLGLIVAWPLTAAVATAATALALAHVARYRRRRARFERRYGFLPEPGRDDLPRNGRTTLFRVELGQRGGRVCVMVVRWEMRRMGWARAEVVHHRWVDGEDAVAFGEARAQAQLLAEKREEDAEDAERLAQEAEARVDSWLDDAHERRLTTRELVKRLASDPD